MEIRCAAVVGLGLMGGSVARAILARGGRVLGFDAEPATRALARAAGVVVPGPEAGMAPLAGAEVIVLALPVRTAVRMLPALAPHCHAGLVTDVGSTKRSIVAAAEAAGLGPRFVGAHPLTGDHRSGWETSRAELLAGERVILTPAPSARAEARTLATAFWGSLGARVEEMDPERHDRLLAWSSHLPQMASSALAHALAAGAIPTGALGPGGRDATRLAGSDSALWTEIALDNADRISPTLDVLIDALAGLRRALRAGDAEAVHTWLRTGARWAAADAREGRESVAAAEFPG